MDIGCFRLKGSIILNVIGRVTEFDKVQPCGVFWQTPWLFITPPHSTKHCRDLGKSSVDDDRDDDEGDLGKTTMYIYSPKRMPKLSVKFMVIYVVFSK